MPSSRSTIQIELNCTVRFFSLILLCLGIFKKSSWSCLGTGPIPEALFVPDVHAASRTIQIGMAYPATRGSGDVLARDVARSNIWFHSPTATRVYVDVRAFCYHQRPYDCLWTGLPPGARMESRDRVAAKAIEI